MRPQTKATGITLPEVHGAKKTLDTNVLPEKQKPQIHREQVDKNKPRLGRGRAGIKCKKPQPVVDITVSAGKYVKHLQFKMLLKIAQLSQYQNN